MRNYLILMSATALAACGGGGGPEAVGGIAPPPAPGGNGTPTPTAHSFVAPTQDKTYDAVGAVHGYNYSTRSDGTAQFNELYAGDATTARDGGITVAYSPARRHLRGDDQPAQGEHGYRRNALSGSRAPHRFRRRAHATGRRAQYCATNRSSISKPAPPAVPPLPLGKPVPTYSDIPYGGEDVASDARTYFYQKPGTTTKYVTYAGFVRNRVSVAEVTAEGILDADGNPYTYLQNDLHVRSRRLCLWRAHAPTARCRASGSATFSGDMIASMVFNPDIDTNADRQHLFPVDHRARRRTRSISARSAFSPASPARVGDVARDAYTNGEHSMPEGSTFTAASRATIDLVGKGGFFGQFNSASFAAACTAPTFRSTSPDRASTARSSAPRRGNRRRIPHRRRHARPADRHPRRVHRQEMSRAQRRRCAPPSSCCAQPGAGAGSRPSR